MRHCASSKEIAIQESELRQDPPYDKRLGGHRTCPGKPVTSASISQMSMTGDPESLTRYNHTELKL
jgi:hypothetical protein